MFGQVAPARAGLTRIEFFGVELGVGEILEKHPLRIFGHGHFAHEGPCELLDHSIGSVVQRAAVNQTVVGQADTALKADVQFLGTRLQAVPHKSQFVARNLHFGTLLRRFVDDVKTSVGKFDIGLERPAYRSVLQHFPARQLALHADQRAVGKVDFNPHPVVFQRICLPGGSNRRSGKAEQYQK